MTRYTFLPTADGLTAAARSLLAEMLARGGLDAVFALGAGPSAMLPMPRLYTDPAAMDGINPLAPVAPFNAARQTSALLRHPTGQRIALVLKPCEVRALVELTKLKQAALENAILIGIECRGRLENDRFLKSLSNPEHQAAGDPTALTDAFYQDPAFEEAVADMCRVCDHFLPSNVDLAFRLIGHSPGETLGVSAHSEAGEKLLADCGLTLTEAAAERDEVADLLKARLERREARFKETASAIDSMEKFQQLIAGCLNCYNCRQACPVCYCRECVFLTDVFAHGPEVLIRRAQKKGPLKLPADTTMFHMTRLAHMAHACVACGQCASVCPSGIPVADVFAAVARKVQEGFGYEAGRDLAEPIPYLVWEGKDEGK